MSNFIDYYNANKKEFKYTIKLAKNDLTEECFSALERHLDKYNIRSFSEFKKTPIQHNPLDFPNIRDSEVYIGEVTLEYPITPDALLREVSSGMKLSEQNVVVYTENDPRKQYSQEWMDRVVNNKEFKEKYKPFLGNIEQWPDEPSYGEKYNSEFLKSLSVAKEGREDTSIENELNPKAKTDSEGYTGEEMPPVFNDSPLNDRWRNSNEFVTNKQNTMMSKNSKE